jgi:hypothetical protein
MESALKGEAAAYLRHQLGTCLQERRPKNKLSQDSRSLGPDPSPRPPEYEARG